MQRSVLFAVFMALASCVPTAGYRAQPINSPNQAIAPPNSVQPSEGNLQPSMPAGGLPGDRDSRPPPQCVRDEDCVPSACCHPRTCVARRAAPRCDEVVCTMSCEPNTLDCGGRCICRGGFCSGVPARAP